jgi:hypothetical protein
MSVERLTVEQLQAWRAEPGWTAITIEIWPHRDLITVTIEDRELDEELRLFETAVKVTEADRADVAYYADMRRTMAEQLSPALARFDRLRIQACAITAIWCVLNHPRDQGVIRLKMERLREEGRAPHFTLCRGERGTYGTALGDRYADLRQDVQRKVDAKTTLFGIRGRRD